MNFINDSTLRIEKDTIRVDVEEKGVRYLKIINNNFSTGELLKSIQKNQYMPFYNSLGGKRRRNNILEDKISFVPMAYGFYFYVVNVGQIPTIKTFCNFFINSFCEKLNETSYHFKENYSNNSEIYFEYQDLAAKICRAYGSYLRELTLLCRLFELQQLDSKYKDFDIFYDIKEDVSGGSDIIIKANQKIYGLLITQKSNNADFYNKKKRAYRHHYNYDKYIYVKLYDDETTTYGDVEIFSETVARNILDKISEECQNN